jgi:nitroreductase
MISRRGLLACGSGLAAGGLLSAEAATAATAKTYDDAAASTWAPLRLDGGARELIRYAALAANSHNTQPWKFTAEARRITIAPDFSRRCPAVDPDDHHLFVSLGCAAENLVQAAAAAGLAATAALASDAIAIDLDPARPQESDLFKAIPRRQSTRAAYDGTAVSNDTLAALEKAGTSAGVSIMMMTDKTKIDAVSDYVAAGNTVQMRDKAFMDELKAWIRFNDADAVAAMDGLSARASGNSQWPAWLARLLLPLVLTERAENDKYRAHIRSSAGIAVLADRSDRAHWVETGRACQRFALQATALGLKQAFVNQPVEVPQVRQQLAAFLGLGDRLPDLVMRFGFGPDLPRSLRRPVEQLMA